MSLIMGLVIRWFGFMYYMLQLYTLTFHLSFVWFPDTLATYPNFMYFYFLYFIYVENWSADLV
jgi:hypothetical protein